MKFSKKAYKTFLLFIFVVFCAAIFRITYLNLIEFKGDEALNLFLATRPIFGHPFPPGSTVSSFGILNFPLINYLLFPIVLITTYPPYVSLAIGIINSFAIGFFFLIIKKYYNTIVALSSSILLAFSSWSILYSRKIWEQDFILPIAVVFIFSIHKIAIEKKRNYWVVAILSTLLLMQIHQAAVIFPALCILFLFRKNKPTWKSLSIGILLGILPMIPYFWYQITQGCPDCSALLNSHNRIVPVLHKDIFLRPFQILNNGNFYFVMGPDLAIINTKFPFVFMGRILLWFEYLFLPIGAFIFWNTYKNVRFFIISIVVTVLLLFFLHIEPFMHYFITFAPLLFLFLGTVFSYLLSKKQVFIKIFAISLFTAITLELIAWNYAFFSILSNKGGLQGDYGSSFRESEKGAISTLQKYTYNPNYKEMFITYFIPQEWMQGKFPLGKIIYPKAQLEKRLEYLKGQLMTNPDDPRVQSELFTYYTYPPLNHITLKLIEIQATASAGYKILFSNIAPYYR